MIVTRPKQDPVEALFSALVNDGFTAYYCGPEDGLVGRVAFYQWDDHVDVITAAPEGGATAA